MSTESTAAALKDLLNFSEPRAIAIKGKWGTGKTHFWREIIVPSHVNSRTLGPGKRGYAYASLFSIGSIQQLKNALAYSYVENRPRSRLGAPVRWGKAFLRWLSHILDRAAGDEMSYMGVQVRAKTLVNELAFLSIKDSLICLDDVERRDNSFPIRDLMGLVSYLVEQRRCRVVVILNVDALTPEEKIDWSAYSEKAFESEMEFRPTVDQVLEVGLKGAETAHWYSLARMKLEHLELANIRVASRVRRFIQQAIREIRKEIPDISDGVLDSVAISLVLFVVADASRALGAPDVEDIISRGWMGQEEKDALPANERWWWEKIRSYGAFFGDALDIALMKSVRSGYPLLEELLPAIRLFQENSIDQAKKEEFSKAWRLYHDSFGANESEVYAAFMAALPGVIATEALHNIEPTARILRSAGHPEAATEMLQAWVDNRKGERIAELREGDFFGGHPKDPELKAMVEAAIEEVMRNPRISLQEALIALNGGDDSEDAMRVASSHGADEIADVLLCVNVDWGPLIRRFLKEQGREPATVVLQERIEAALDVVAGKSALNADRVANKLSR